MMATSKYARKAEPCGPENDISLRIRSTEYKVRLAKPQKPQADPHADPCSAAG